MRTYSNTVHIYPRLIGLIFLMGLSMFISGYVHSNADLHGQTVDDKSTSEVASSSSNKTMNPTLPETTKLTLKKNKPTQPEPYTQNEIRQGLKDMHQKMISSIEAWGNTLKPEDFERGWRGRQLNKAKRQEVCAIYQHVINDTYHLATANKARLSPKDQRLLSDRHVFIQSLGFKNNIVDTKMGFNCRLK